MAVFSPDSRSQEAALTGFSLQLQIHCPGCLTVLALNALAERYFCPDCGREIRITPVEWGQILHDPLLHLYYLSGKGPLEGDCKVREVEVHYLLARATPVFPGSGRTVPCSPDDPQSDRITDPETGASVLVRRLPAAVVPFLPLLVALSGEAESQLPLSGEEGAYSGIPGSGSPHTFLCSRCGAALPIEAGGRVVHCASCGNEVPVPDPLWQQLHPQREAVAWYGWLDPGRETWSSFGWSYIHYALGDPEGNIYATGRCRALPEQGIFAAFTPERKLDWISRDACLKRYLWGYSHSPVTVSAGDNLLYWTEVNHAEKKRAFQYYAKQDGTKRRSPSSHNLFGNAAPGGMQTVDWVILDLDGSVLLNRYRYPYWYWELVRFSETGEQLPVWSGKPRRRWFGGNKPVYFPQLKDRRLFCQLSIDLGWQGLDGSYYLADILDDTYTDLARFTRDGKRQYFLHRAGCLRGLCGNAAGEAFALFEEWVGEAQLYGESGRLLEVRRNSLYRIGPAGEMVKIAPSVLDSGVITRERFPLLMPGEEILLLGDGGQSLRFTPEGVLLDASPQSAALAAEWRQALEDAGSASVHPEGEGVDE